MEHIISRAGESEATRATESEEHAKERSQTKAVDSEPEPGIRMAPLLVRLVSETFRIGTGYDCSVLQLKMIRMEVSQLNHKDAHLKMQDMKRNFMDQDWDIGKYLRMMNQRSPFLMAVFQQGFRFSPQQAMLALQSLIYRKCQTYKVLKFGSWPILTLSRQSYSTPGIPAFLHSLYLYDDISSDGHRLFSSTASSTCVGRS